jgi:hypothetical protein
MASRTAAKGGPLDPFRARLVPKVTRRLDAERDQHRRQADLAWTGVLVSQFTVFELRLLDDLGFLSQHDKDLIAAVRKKQESPGRRC